jgi:hypothetical protein
MLIFVDELGCNTNEKQEVDNEKYLCPKCGRPQKLVMMKNSHFTILGFTATDGNPLFCTIIFAAKSICKEWVMGLDPFTEWIGDENNTDENSDGPPTYQYAPLH